MSYLQPHEGITGTDRTDVVLTSPEASALIGRLISRLYSASLVNAPRARRVFEWMTHPRAGDLVVVDDAMHQRDPDTQRKGVGYLIAHRAEWWSTDEQWAASKAEDGYLEESDRMVEPHAWYVQYGPNAEDVCRWVNCSVLSAEPEPRG